MLEYDLTETIKISTLSPTKEPVENPNLSLFVSSQRTKLIL